MHKHGWDTYFILHLLSGSKMRSVSVSELAAFGLKLISSSHLVCTPLEAKGYFKNHMGGGLEFLLYHSQPGGEMRINGSERCSPDVEKNSVML